MRFRLSFFGLAGLILASALTTIALVHPMDGASRAAGRNAAAAKPSAQSNAKSSAVSGSIEKSVETYLRRVYAWGPSFQLKVDAPKPSPIPDLYEVNVAVTEGGSTDSAVVYVSKDGRYMMRGTLEDLNSDPLADNLHKMNLQGAASKGPADAKVVVVEYGDLECPSCRQLDYVLRAVLPKYPQVRFVFRDFPLESIHPWAMTAAVTGRCVLQQNSDAFWKYHDAVYDNQDLISPENAYDKLTQLAVQAGANADKLKACTADPKAQEEVRNSIAEGKALEVTSTPTTFVDGRRLVGPDQNTLDQFIEYDTQSH
jgi:protein-disulfide isomerase